MSNFFRNIFSRESSSQSISFNKKIGKQKEITNEDILKCFGKSGFKRKFNQIKLAFSKGVWVNHKSVKKLLGNLTFKELKEIEAQYRTIVDNKAHKASGTKKHRFEIPSGNQPTIRKTTKFQNILISSIERTKTHEIIFPVESWIGTYVSNVKKENLKDEPLFKTFAKKHTDADFKNPKVSEEDELDFVISALSEHIEDWIKEEKISADDIEGGLEKLLLDEKTTKIEFNQKAEVKRSEGGKEFIDTNLESSKTKVKRSEKSSSKEGEENAIELQANIAEYSDITVTKIKSALTEIDKSIKCIQAFEEAINSIKDEEVIKKSLLKSISFIKKDLEKIQDKANASIEKTASIEDLDAEVDKIGKNLIEQGFTSFSSKISKKIRELQNADKETVESLLKGFQEVKESIQDALVDMADACLQEPETE